MENQHREIKGYRELNQDEINLMNQIKSMGVDIGLMVDQVREVESIDQRWVSIAATHLQQGLMALTRSVAKPSTF